MKRNNKINRIDDIVQHLKTFVRDPKNVSALFPCSRFVAKAMTKNFKKKGCNILEVGAGVGSLTKEFVKLLRPEDKLFVVERDLTAVEILKNKFSSYENVFIYCSVIEKWIPKNKFDFIISTLPFNSFDVEFINEVLCKYKEWIKEGGIISYVEYIALGRIKKILLRIKNAASFKEYAKAQAYLKKFKKESVFHTDNIWLNIFPIYVHHAYL